jgi:CBS domain-containing protein
MIDPAPRNFGVVDNRFLARSVGLLNPPSPQIMMEDDSVRDALEKLKQHKIGSVVIVDAAGKISGIFSERDVVLKVSLSEVNIDDTPISKLMTKNPQTATMTTTLAFALNMMSQGGYRHIPVVDDANYPVGVISVKNIVDFIVHALTRELVSVSPEGLN